MQLKEFAAANRLKTKFTGAEDVIPGKYGELAEMNVNLTRETAASLAGPGFNLPAQR
jgi:hypothetical protein